MMAPLGVAVAMITYGITLFIILKIVRRIVGRSYRLVSGVIALTVLGFLADGLFSIAYDLGDSVLSSFRSHPNYSSPGVSQGVSQQSVSEDHPTSAAPVTESTPPLTPFEQAPTQLLYSVVGVAAGDTLNVHSGAASSNSITARLPNGYSGITIIGASVMNNTTEWVNISFRDGSGWVNKVYLKAD